MNIHDIQKIIEKKVYGKIEAAHDDRGHHYRFVDTGTVEDSVTTRNVLDKPHLVSWSIGLAIDFLSEGDRWQRLSGPERESLIKSAKLQHTDVRDDAGTVGGDAHDVIEHWIKEWISTGVKPGDIREYVARAGHTDYRVVAACRAAEAVFGKYNVVPVATELLVGVEGYGAGTLDLLVLNEKGELELFDWKTSNNINDFYSIQVSAYKKLFEMMTGLKIKSCKILKIDKFSDKFKAYNIPNTTQAWRAFKSLSVVYHWQNNGQDKLVEDKKIVKL